MFNLEHILIFYEHTQNFATEYKLQWKFYFNSI